MNLVYTLTFPTHLSTWIRNLWFKIYLPSIRMCKLLMCSSSCSRSICHNNSCWRVVYVWTSMWFISTVRYLIASNPGFPFRILSRSFGEFVLSGGAPTPLAHPCLWWWTFPHILKCELKTWWDMGMGHLWLKWVGHLWRKLVVATYHTCKSYFSFTGCTNTCIHVIRIKYHSLHLMPDQNSVVQAICCLLFKFQT